MVEARDHCRTRRFQPGRYVDSLKERKRSVTRFVKAHQGELARIKDGDAGIDFDLYGDLVFALSAGGAPNCVIGQYRKQ